MDYLSFPQRALFDKLGIRTMVLETDPYGNFLTQGYELASARDWARLGNLYLQDGVWNGERLLPEGFVKFVSTVAPAWKPTTAPSSGSTATASLGHFKGSASGQQASNRALSLLMEAVPKRQ